MKRLFFPFFICFLCNYSLAYEWRDAKNQKENIVGDFVCMAGKSVLIEKEDKTVVSVPIESLTEDDRFLAKNLQFYFDYVDVQKQNYDKTEAARKQITKDKTAAFVKKYHGRRFCIQYAVHSLDEQGNRDGWYRLSTTSPLFMHDPSQGGFGENFAISIPKQDVSQIDRNCVLVCMGNLVFSSKDKILNSDWTVNNNVERFSVRGAAISVNTPLKTIKFNSKLKKISEINYKKNEVPLARRIGENAVKLLNREPDANKEAIEKARSEALEN